METALPTVHTFLVNAVIEHVRSSDTGLHHLRLLHEHDPIDAWSWLPTEPVDANRVLKAEVCRARRTW